MGRLFDPLDLTIPKSLAAKSGSAPAKREKDEAPMVASAPVHVLKLMARHQKIKPGLDSVIKKGGELAASVHKQLDDFARALVQFA